jgi:hypothetical protein
MFVSNTPAWEMESSKLSVTFILCVNVGLLVVFSFAATMMGDAAKSKPLVGFAGKGTFKSNCPNHLFF